jgi:predicted  nucleic acid-binding Zn-ribbon protein
VTELVAQPDGDEETRIVFQSLVDSLITENNDKLSPEELILFYQELVHQQPSSSTSPEQNSIHQILLEAVSVADDVLNDRVLALEMQAKDAAKQDSLADPNEIEAARSQLASQRKLLVSFIKSLIVSF